MSESGLSTERWSWSSLNTGQEENQYNTDLSTLTDKTIRSPNTIYYLLKKKKKNTLLTPNFCMVVYCISALYQAPYSLV